MRKRTLGAATIVGSLVLTAGGHASAGGALLSAGAVSPIEQRVAIAAGPERTTLWTSVRLSGDAGPIGLVIPVPPGASLDTSSDAWFEALEVATAPRVFPPDGVSLTCPGSTEPTDPFHVAGSLGHEPSLAPAEVKVLGDADAVSVWAGGNALTLAPDLKAKLYAMSDARFMAVRFNATGNIEATRTLRVVMPGSVPALPLTLTRATDRDLRVTAWLIGQGSGSIAGSTAVAVPEGKITWNVKTSESSYADARADALIAAGPSGSVLESAGHDPLSNNVPIASGKSAIDGVITTFFERAAGYGEGAPETEGCIAQAAAALASGTPVAASCPRADFGVVDGSDACVEAPAGHTDPSALRCGAGADDLAVALSGLVPESAWLTRQTMLIGKGSAGTEWPIKFASAAALSPITQATSLNVSECGAPDAGPDGSQTGGSGSSSSGGASGGPGNGSSGGVTGGSTDVDVYIDSSAGCDCSGTADTVEWEEETTTEPDTIDDYDTYDEGDDCSGDTTGASDSGDDCDSGGSESYGGDDCDSGGGESYGGDDCDTGSSGSDTSCDSGGSGSEVDCSGGSGSGDCAIAGSRRDGKRRGPKLSVLTLGAMALLAPLRRLGTRRNQRELKRTKKGRGAARQKRGS